MSGLCVIWIHPQTVVTVEEGSILDCNYNRSKYTLAPNMDRPDGWLPFSAMPNLVVKPPGVMRLYITVRIRQAYLGTRWTRLHGLFLCHFSTNLPCYWCVVTARMNAFLQEFLRRNWVRTRDATACRIWEEEPVLVSPHISVITDFMSYKEAYRIKITSDSILKQVYRQSWARGNSLPSATEYFWPGMIRHSRDYQDIQIAWFLPE